MKLKDGKKLKNKIFEQNEAVFKYAKYPALCFFGSGEYCWRMLKWFNKYKLQFPMAICDNNLDNHGLSEQGIPIISFKEALELYENPQILITSVNFADEIENQILDKLSNDNILNIGNYFKPKKLTLFEQSSKEIRKRISRYTSNLRRGGVENFPLLKPEDMPKHAKEVGDKLNYYKTAYDNDQDMNISIDNYYITEYDCNFWEDDLDIIPKSVQLIKFMNTTCFNSVYKYGPNNEHLLCHELKEPRVDLYKNAENVTQFNSWLSKKGIPFLYVQLPNKISPIEKTLPKGTSNYQNFVANEFVSKLKYTGVNTLDYRQVMIDESINFCNSFMKTDNHWKPSLAFHATKKICEELTKVIDLEFDQDKLSIENYQVLNFDNLFLGAWGKRTGLIYGGLDNFELLLPKYETDFTWKCDEKGFFVRGPFEKSLIFSVHMDWSYFDLNVYTAYYAVSGSHTEIYNHKFKNIKKIIYLYDSFSMPISSFMAPQFSELHFVDMRKNLDKYYVFDLINRVTPDAVVMAYWPGATCNSKVMNINPYV